MLMCTPSAAKCIQNIVATWCRRLLRFEYYGKVQRSEHLALQYRVVLVYSFSTCILYTHACIYLCVSVCILVHVCGVLSYEIIHDSARGGLKTALHPIVINSSDCFSPVTACVTTSDTATPCTVHIDPTTPVMFDGDWSLYYTHDDIACMVAWKQMPHSNVC